MASGHKRSIQITWGRIDADDAVNTGRFTIPLWPLATVLVLVIIGLWVIPPRFHTPASTIPVAHLTTLPTVAPTHAPTADPAQVVNVPVKPGSPVCIVSTQNVKKNSGVVKVTVP